MIKLTDFNSVVDTYKKNFNIRSKRFALKKKKDTTEKIQKRENKIENKKFFDGLKGAAGNIANKIKPGGDILDTVIRFGVFTLLGLIVKNIDKVGIFIKQVIEKIKEFATQAKKFFDDVLVPLYEDIVELATDIKETFEDISDFVINMNPYNELSDTLDTVMMGILALGYRMAGSSVPKPTPPGAAPAKASAAKTPVKTPAKTPAKTPVTTPVKTPIKTRPLTFAKNPLKTTTPAQTPASVGAGAGSGSQSGVPKQTSASGMMDDALRNMLDDLSDQGVRALGEAEQYKKPIGPKQLIPDTPTQLLGRAIGSDIANLIKTYKKLGLSNSDLLKIANDIDGESFNERKAAYEILKKKGLADRVFNVPDASKVFPKPVNRTPEGILRGPGFRAPTIPPAQQPLTILQKLQKSLDINAKRLQTLTKGLDFRFDAGKVIKEQLLDPKNFVKNLGSFGLGVGIDIGARSLAKYISNILPYDEDFETLAYLGLIDPDRIAQLTATKIIKLPEYKRKEVLKKLEKDSKSSNDIFGIGQRKKDMANDILKYINIFSLGKIGLENISEIKEDKELEMLEFPEHFAPVIPESLINKPDPTIIPKNKSADDAFFYPDGTKLTPGMTVGKLNNTSGLDSPTTYGSQGVMISREVVIAIQPVEVPA